MQESRSPHWETEKAEIFRRGWFYGNWVRIETIFPHERTEPHLIFTIHDHHENRDITFTAGADVIIEIRDALDNWLHADHKTGQNARLEAEQLEEMYQAGELDEPGIYDDMYDKED